MAGTITIKRSELYRLVWAQPMMHLAKTYGLSDVGLAKICRKLDIPRPPRGYWAMVQAGQQPAQTPLPHRQHDEEIRLSEPVPDDDSASPLSEQVRQQIKAERQPERRIAVAASLQNCHPLVSRAHQELQGVRTDKHGILVPRQGSALNIRTSIGGLQRALLIMDALLKALEQRGYSVAKGPIAKIQGSPLEFCVSESLETKREPSDDHDLNGAYEFGHSRFKEIEVPSGLFALEILSNGPWGHSCRRSWRDTKTQRLEDLLNPFVAGLIRMAELIKVGEEEGKQEAERQHQQELRRQEEARQRAERRKLYQAEKARVEQLMTEVEFFHRSQRVRAWIEAVRQANIAKGPLDPDSKIAQWIEWATQQADRLDPLCPSPPSILDEKDLEGPTMAIEAEP